MSHKALFRAAIATPVGTLVTRLFRDRTVSDGTSGRCRRHGVGGAPLTNLTPLRTASARCGYWGLNEVVATLTSNQQSKHASE